MFMYSILLFNSNLDFKFPYYFILITLMLYYVLLSFKYIVR